MRNYKVITVFILFSISCIPLLGQGTTQTQKIDTSFYGFEKEERNMHKVKLGFSKLSPFEKAMLVKLLTQDTVFSSFIYERKFNTGVINSNTRHSKQQLRSKLKEAMIIVNKANKEFSNEQKERYVQKFEILN